MGSQLYVKPRVGTPCITDFVAKVSHLCIPLLHPPLLQSAVDAATVDHILQRNVESVVEFQVNKGKYQLYSRQQPATSPHR